MSLIRNILRTSCHVSRAYRTFHVRHKSITGYDTADNALKTVTGGRIYRWLDAYEDFVGLTEVRLAQDLVTKAETDYRCIQEVRRATQQQLTAVQNRIKAVALEIEKTKRGTDTYLNLVTKENEIIKEEKDILDQLTIAEDNEKHSFALLSSALRESHEKERARAERMKYWGIIGSIIGAVIGIFGTSINNYMKMKELRNIVTDATEMNRSYREKTMDLSMSINDQYGKIYQFLVDINSAMGNKQDIPRISTPGKKDSVGLMEKQERLEEILASLKQQEAVFDREIKKIGQVLASKQIHSAEGAVVYVGPEVETMLKDTEKNLEWKMKIQALGTVTLIYAIAAVSIPILLKVFGGS